MMKRAKIISIVFLAAAAGVFTGLLFAPEKGSRTRRKILEKGEDAFDDLKGSARHSVNKFQRNVGLCCSGNKLEKKGLCKQSAEMTA